MEAQKLYTEREAANLLNVSLSTIRRWRKAGTIPFFRVGDILRYRHDSLMMFIESNMSSKRDRTESVF